MQPIFNVVKVTKYSDTYKYLAKKKRGIPHGMPLKTINN